MSLSIIRNNRNTTGFKLSQAVINGIAYRVPSELWTTLAFTNDPDGAVKKFILHFIENSEESALLGSD